MQYRGSRAHHRSLPVCVSIQYSRRSDDNFVMLMHPGCSRPFRCFRAHRCICQRLPLFCCRDLPNGGASNIDRFCTDRFNIVMMHERNFLRKSLLRVHLLRTSIYAHTHTCTRRAHTHTFRAAGVILFCGSFGFSQISEQRESFSFVVPLDSVKCSEIP